MRSSRAIVWVMGLSALAGTAAAMPTDPPQAAPSNTTTAANSTTATATTAVTPDERKAKDLAYMIQRAKDAGFKPEKHRGETWYCIKSIPIASRLPVKQCANEEGLLVLLDRTQETKDSMKIMNYTPGIKDQPAAK
jgi:hypothetical protein